MASAAEATSWSIAERAWTFIARGPNSARASTSADTGLTSTLSRCLLRHLIGRRWRWSWPTACGTGSGRGCSTWPTPSSDSPSSSLSSVSG